jgi:hypothetical protein
MEKNSANEKAWLSQRNTRIEIPHASARRCRPSPSHPRGRLAERRYPHQPADMREKRRK